MPLFDLSLAECREYRPELPVPGDLGTFWTDTLRDAGKRAGPTVCERIDNGLTLIDTYDVAFTGFDGEQVRGWLHTPAGAERAGRSLGCVVEFLGYGRGRGLPHANLLWASAGYAHLIMDTRGQGWSAATGDTPDRAEYPAGTVPGFLTRGLAHPEEHYYRRLITDAVRCVEIAREHPLIDADRVIAAGISQGGGLALAVSGLVPGLAGVMPDVPFLCHIRRGVDLATAGPYGEIAEYLRLHRDRTATAFDTLAYVDAAHLASRADAPALFSVALQDPVCPPSTCFAAYNHYPGRKDIRVYEFNGHEGGAEHQQREQLPWVHELIG